MCGAAKKSGPIGSAVLLLNTNRQTDKQNIYINVSNVTSKRKQWKVMKKYFFIRQSMILDIYNK